MTAGPKTSVPPGIPDCLKPVARFCAAVDTAVAALPTPNASLPCWEDYGPDFGAGVPLLHSSSVTIELEPVGRMVATLLERLSASTAGTELAADIRALRASLERPADAERVALWLLGDDGFAPPAPGLLRYLGWSALARYLEPLVAGFAGWRDEDRWLRSHCPACGNMPAMAQLVGVDPGRKRYLACGCCRTRWRHSRTRCPFCENDSQRVAVVTVVGDARLRLDYCESCRGYIKTYGGAGEESVMLADWTSLHLDVIAHDRGLKRSATSLFDFESLHLA